jgi:predicted regulator of Ras-like GTPase activity (Roadblock/LC7/MglB family)
MSQQPLELVLQELTTLPGVRSGFLGDLEGTVLAAVHRAGATLVDPAAPVRSLSRTLAGLKSIHRSAKPEMDLVFEHGRVLLRTGENRFLALVCDRQLNLPLLTTALDEAVHRMSDITSGKAAVVGAGAVDVQSVVRIAREVLGDRADKVVELLETSDGSKESLSTAIGRAEEITRLFIDNRNAKEMARRMRASLFQREG